MLFRSGGDAGSATRVKRGRPPRDHRRVIDGVLWIALTGGAWRELPAEYGNWSSVYRQFLRWSEGRPMAPSARCPAGERRADASKARLYAARRQKMLEPVNVVDAILDIGVAHQRAEQR
ncbi:transposase [Methylosinus sp. KRF6]|uniref:transposase n=1 Tax=Methylosinus sp. KRF6 TaxID=2846853 RepID=UPI0035300FEC